MLLLACERWTFSSSLFIKQEKSLYQLILSMRFIQNTVQQVIKMSIWETRTIISELGLTRVLLYPGKQPSWMRVETQRELMSLEVFWTDTVEHLRICVGCHVFLVSYWKTQGSAHLNTQYSISWLIKIQKLLGEVSISDMFISRLFFSSNCGMSVMSSLYKTHK